jgi:uncharacterized protein YjeT (DUF2065 family)
VVDFLAAIGLVLVFEGLLYGGFPRLAKTLASRVADMPEASLRGGGVAMILAGVIVIWLVRG